jgi:hypothetical protein
VKPGYVVTPEINPYSTSTTSHCPEIQEISPCPQSIVPGVHTAAQRILLQSGAYATFTASVAPQQVAGTHSSCVVHCFSTGMDVHPMMNKRNAKINRRFISQTPVRTLTAH